MKRQGFAVIGAMACQNLQTDLFNYFGELIPGLRTYGDVSLLKWLLSPQNTAGFERINVTSIPGKKRAVAFRVLEPMCFDIARTTRLCTDDIDSFSQTPKEMVYSFPGDPYRVVDGAGEPLRLEIDLQEMEQFCTVDDNSWIQNQVFRFLERVEDVLDLRMWELLVAGVGTNKAGAATTNLPIFTNAGGKTHLNPEAVFYLRQTMKNIMVDKQFGMMGGELVNKINTYTGWLGLDDAGVDMSLVSPKNPYAFYDRNAEEALATTEDFLLMAPGAAQLVIWNRYGPGSSKRSMVTDLFSNGTITLPRTGLTVDWKWRYDADCLKWFFEVEVYLDLVIVPPGGCATPGVNGIVRIHDCSGIPIVPECPAIPAE